MFKINHYPVLVRNVVALMAISGAGVTAMCAQTPAAQPTAAQAQPSIDLHVPAVDTSSDRLFSSSADEDAAAPVAVASLHPTVANFGEAMQYGGGQRRRYGKPRYRGANTNEDGSSKYIFYGAAGLAQPLGNTYHYLTPSYGIEVGGGRQFNKHFAVPVEFDYDHFGLTKQNISNQSCLYTYVPASGETPASCDPNAADNGIDANSHIWSFSVDPTYHFYQGETVGAYVVAGVGFYHKVTNFTAPQEGFECYYVCGEVEYQSNFDHYTSNAVGYNGGFGVTYKFSHFSNEQFFAEARYVFIDNSQRYGYTVNNVATTTYDGADYYPANSNRTTYLPVKVGIRF